MAGCPARPPNSWLLVVQRTTDARKHMAPTKLAALLAHQHLLLRPNCRPYCNARTRPHPHPKTAGLLTTI